MTMLRNRWTLAFAFLFWLCGSASLPAQTSDFEDALELFRTGAYEDAEKATRNRVAPDYGRRWRRRRDVESENWATLRARVLLSLGRYEDAVEFIDDSLYSLNWSLQLRWELYRAAASLGDDSRRQRTMSEMNQLAAQSGAFFDAPLDQVALGRMAIALGADPKLVLKNFYDPVASSAPETLEVYQATGDLALSKRDFALAADSFRAGLQRYPDDADLLHGLAASLESSDRERMAESLEKALARNPNHVASHLLIADLRIDAEDYSGAQEALDAVEQVNPRDPVLWAYRAVIAHLNNDPAEEKVARDKALETNGTNPEVPHLIGRKLSERYRFVEGSTYQRMALTFDEDYLPAKTQLAQDLLRLGDTQEGWTLAEESHEGDAYNVTAYNLVTLRDNIAQAQSLESPHFLVRMDPVEAMVYGDEVLQTLEEAYGVLTKKYSYTPPQKIQVEIFSNPKDFEVRTFGMPNIPGFVAVCFGPVITSNSPATGSNAFNWRSVLWHELTHTITLGLTRNKMPRWLSEGVSVHEERAVNGYWGMRLNLEFYDMIKADQFVPIEEISSMFMTPKTPRHIQLAYFQSSWVVDLIVEQYGFPALRRILVDLGIGKTIEEALEANTAPLSELNEAFGAFVDVRMESLATDLSLERPETLMAHDSGPLGALNRAAGELSTDTLRQLYPDNYWTLFQTAIERLESEDWEGAKEPLDALIDRYPEQRDTQSAYHLLARVHRELGETQAEKRALETIASLDPEAEEAYRRLTNMALAEEDWESALHYSSRILEVAPFDFQVYEDTSIAAEALGQQGKAKDALQKALRLDPPDPARAHFRLARLSRESDPSFAKAQLLRALESAPRYRDAYHELVQLMQNDADLPKPPPGAAPSNE